MTQLTCGDPRRRGDAREHGLNGIDSITVSEDQRTLAVILFGKAPPGLTPASFRIDGGRPVTVTGLQPCPEQDPDLPDCLQLTVDRPGDFSCYRLCVVATDASGRPTSEPYDGFDVRYFCADFSFKQNCPSPGDCAPPCDTASAAPAEPVIDYLARDYASLRQALLDRLSLTMPDWTEQHLPDVGITLVELLAYAGDLLNYRLDAVGTEAYLDTARLRTSVRRHARLVGYRMHDGCAARAYVCLTVSGTLTMPAGDFRFSAGAEIFRAAHRRGRHAVPAAQRDRPVDLGGFRVLPAGWRDVGRADRRRARARRRRPAGIRGDTRRRYRADGGRGPHAPPGRSAYLGDGRPGPAV